MSDMALLEKKLNGIIDAETEKGYERADTGLIAECANTLLRMDNEKRYLLSEEEYRNSTKLIFGEKKKPEAVHKKIRILLIAAIIILLSLLAATAYELNKYDIIQFPDHLSVITAKKHHPINEELSVGYIPEGFSEFEEKQERYTEEIHYCNVAKELYIKKVSSFDTVMVNNGGGIKKKTEENGITYTIYQSTETYSAVMWVANDCLYNVFGDVNEKEIMKIASSVR